KGRINAAYNAIDRHVKTARKNKVALYWENEAGDKKEYSFWQLSALSNKFANLLKKYDVQKGERVFIFLPRIPELYTSFLGILKTGAIAGTMFQAFGPSGLFDRLSISGARFLMTNREMSARVYKIKDKLPRLEKIIIVDDKPRHSFEIDYRTQMKKASDQFKVAQMDPEDFAFELFTSGTTGKPKGVMHEHYAILQEHMTSKWVLDIHDEDILWCTADPGWVTGIGYTILGVWSAGASEVVFNGKFDPARWYEILQNYKVTVWYTAPTAIRMLMKAGDDLVKKYDLSNLRHLASVGEPLNPEPIRWGMKVFGLPFHDNWWQTETGGICIANYLKMDIKLGSMGKPIPGVIVEIVDDKGNVLGPNKEGNLALKPGFAGIMKTIWRRPAKYKSYFITPVIKQGSRQRRGSYFEDGMASHERGAQRRAEWYISGDLAYKDKDGYFWFIGRADDVIKTAGERVGPFEVESALVDSGKVVEAGVIGKPDPERGEIIKAFCVLKPGVAPSESLKQELSDFVKKHLAGHAYPKEIEFIPSLPKTRSGKIMRRVLKAKELGLPIGDTSTLEEY
ncbi:MAG: acetate--CoA ligase, partial [Candidatus Nealsonbacteria bacterium CG07_land_8_20_14_0_80_40_10]